MAEMTKLTANRDKQIIVNDGGMAHTTGFMVRQDGLIQRGTARRKTKSGTVIFCAEFFGETYPACNTVDDFKTVTGWTAPATCI